MIYGDREGEELGAFSMLEQSMRPDMMTLEDLDPEVVANMANQEAMEPVAMNAQDMKEQTATLLQEQAAKKAAQSLMFQQNAYMMNRSQGK